MISVLAELAPVSANASQQREENRMTYCREAEDKLVQDFIWHAEERLARQRQLVASLPAENELAEVAQQVLAVLEESLERHRQHLAWVRLN